MKVLVLTGPESSGKSWLSAEIQRRFGGVMVGEYVREFIDRQGRDTRYSDIPAIAQGQLAWEDAARASAPQLLILDTHLLSNMLWSRTLFGDCPAWIEQQLLGRSYDLHLLLSPQGVDWISDGQRCQPALGERQAFFDASRAWLDSHQQAYQVLDGDWQQRREQAMAAVSNLLGPSADLMLVQQTVEGRSRNP
ncbi:AAA family ATPase [Pseudomonas cannabina]|uniref:AAA family ATPase n=2 Tax=Pseudomonas syringae group TaxID=136849 RepID=A0A8T8C273_PSEYM|nr:MULTISPECIES: AAA family ATPase [Pseudomonas syringae group]MBM0138046.1 AAA family ATPase [Pseudomonas cannabina pv. alisalensis]QHE97486.1 AAA family ATPase [Pseudomonas syringae pv. maculicola str. ES4326]QQN24261.1 AAA family ATPase [Pseudomonas cannabina pv. alisalensis]UBY98160.1 AAA family ATPase [Pseudomonas cannabina pv. alisalensis]